VNPRWLKPGDVLAGVGGVLVLVALLVPWYSLSLPGDALQGVAVRVSGWEAFTVVDVLLALAGLAGIALTVASATRRSPVLPVSLGAIASVVGFVATLLVLVRILDQPGPDEFLDVAIGAWIALVGALAITAGAWSSMSDERNRGVEPVPVELRATPPAGPEAT
jgi:hypothetical protein